MENDVPFFALHSFTSVVKEFNDFLDAYYPIKIIIPPSTKTNQNPPENRICRFCKKSSNEVSFNSIAHIIPEFLGNRFLISDFECDECNSKFSKYETDFAGWLGAIRTVLNTSGKKGVPTFKPFREGMSARIVDFLSNRVTKISDQNSEKDAIKLNKETGEVIFQFKKEAYTPIGVYKALLKIALSMIDQNEIEEYRNVCNFLIGIDNNPSFKSFAKVMYHELFFDHQVEKPLGMLFKRIGDSKRIPLHFFLLYYENFIYAFPIPFNQIDVSKDFYKNSINVLFPPPILLKQPDDSSDFHNHIHDFSQSEKIYNEEQTMRLHLSPDQMKRAFSFDPKTGDLNTIDLDSLKIAGFYMVPAGTKIPTNRKFELP